MSRRDDRTPQEQEQARKDAGAAILEALNAQRERDAQDFAEFARLFATGTATKHPDNPNNPAGGQNA